MTKHSKYHQTLHLAQKADCKQRLCRKFQSFMLFARLVFGMTMVITECAPIRRPDDPEPIMKPGDGFDSLISRLQLLHRLEGCGFKCIGVWFYKENK